MSNTKRHCICFLDRPSRLLLVYILYGYLLWFDIPYPVTIIWCVLAISIEKLWKKSEKVVFSIQEYNRCIDGILLFSSIERWKWKLWLCSVSNIRPPRWTQRILETSKKPCQIVVIFTFS